ncbi:hypothetical protein Desgi_3149 [Desulfoscipio gibsoniae DSM 7213]|uniref:Uncharacterized protein n=1 Tax=Desulfoscipio gibsoniae DSM 7213 TaxID=767817 RepID=R4KSF1_9FIRM|nr:hypothetical protein Desgi_3149 [Desulfoscipio gibsoniae DSM 7213]
MTLQPGYLSNRKLKKIKGEDSRVELAKAGDVTILASKQADGNMFTKTTVRTKNGGFYNA